jgi:hypothetical protein
MTSISPFARWSPANVTFTTDRMANMPFSAGCSKLSRNHDCHLRRIKLCRNHRRPPTLAGRQQNRWSGTISPKLLSVYDANNPTIPTSSLNLAFWNATELFPMSGNFLAEGQERLDWVALMVLGHWSRMALNGHLQTIRSIHWFKVWCGFLQSSGERWYFYFMVSAVLSERTWLFLRLVAMGQLLFLFLYLNAARL